ncbi:hypothetical protein CTI12_AA145570 [Artemisia annua]|uniref:Uncharacterized protein n=1 Tax=Artemisia annua TaxID=35608 RepID=A0A2U1PJ28_ARTAN|nr:hypothetical protein CTI12_AA145570 [Artemisia annua]
MVVRVYSVLEVQAFGCICWRISGSRTETPTTAAAQTTVTSEMLATQTRTPRASAPVAARTGVSRSHPTPPMTAAAPTTRGP